MNGEEQDAAGWAWGLRGALSREERMVLDDALAGAIMQMQRNADMLLRMGDKALRERERIGVLEGLRKRITFERV